MGKEESLTYRDRQIMACWALGEEVAQIAARLRMTGEDVQKVIDANADDKPDVTVNNPLPKRLMDRFDI